MKFIELQKNFKDQRIFSTKDLVTFFGSRFKSNLLSRVKKGYIAKITKGWYYFNDSDLTQGEVCMIANKIYEPSYISLEYALNSYNIIPEGVFAITSITSKKTTILSNERLHFSYRNIKKEYFFGYKIFTGKSEKHCYKIATLEKAIIDYIYLYPQLKSKEDFYELRWNIDELKEQIDMKQFKKMVSTYRQKTFLQRIKTFIAFINSDDRHYQY